MSKTPTQVTEAAELAEKLHSQLFREYEEETPEEDISKEEVDEGEVVEGEQEDDDEDDVPHDDDIEELRKFKSRYLSLKGKYDAEVPTLHKELREFKQNVVDRLASITDATPKHTEVDTKNDIITQLSEDYGSDFVASVKLLAEQIADEKIKASITPMQEKMETVEDTQIKVAQEDFKKYLDAKVDGDWRFLWEGKDPKFNKFLSEPDPSGLYTWGELVELYSEKWEQDKLAKVINTYFKSKPTKKQADPNPEKDAMVAPNRTNVHNTPDTEDKTIWTKDSIKEFQRLDRQGKFTPEESIEKWNDLLAAANEGRIR